MTTLSPPLAPDAARRRTTRDAVAVAVLVAGVLFIYGRTVGYGFVNYDDPGYVYHNPHVRAGLPVGRQRRLGVSRTVRAGATATRSPNWLSADASTRTASDVRPGGVPFRGEPAALHAARYPGLLFRCPARGSPGRFWPAAVAAVCLSRPGTRSASSPSPG